MKEHISKQKEKEFNADLLWALLTVFNHLLMTAAAGIMSIPLHRCEAVQSDISRVPVSLVLFLILYAVFSHIYQGLRVSIQRISEMIYSQTLACIFSDIVLYGILWLITDFFVSPLWMLLVLAVQFGIAVLWSFGTNKLYFRMNCPRRTVLVYNHRSGLRKLIEEYGLEKKFQLESIYHMNDVIEDVSVLKDYETVFITDVHSTERNSILKYCVENNIQLIVLPTIGDALMSSAKQMHMFHLPMLEVNSYRPAPYYLILKRGFDILVSLLALIILSPIFLITALFIKAEDGGPVFYKQERMTRFGKKFMIHKFRSMRVDAEKDGVARLSTGANDSRITPVGRFIRAVRIDELPQLIDILKGDLSIVGPRPEREEIALQYEKELPEFRLRLLTKAGLTGYAQVYGKYNTTPYDKLQMDLMYIAHPSLMQDLKICFATVKILFIPDSTEGIAEGSVTALAEEANQDE